MNTCCIASFLLQGCGLMYKVVMWRLGCRKKKKVTPNDVEKQLDRIVVIQPGKEVELPKKHSGQAHAITMDTADTSTDKTIV